MTARPFFDPVHGAAFTAGLTPVLPALPCPTCRGTGWRCRNSNLMCTHRVHQGCEDCTGSGVWTPPDSPVPIGVTSAEPKDGQRFGSWATYCLSERWFLTPHDRVVLEPRAAHPIVLSSMIGEGTLRKVKVVEADADGHGAVVEMRPDGSLWFWPEGAFGEDAATDISSALPFLPGLKPGDTVYLLDGFTESVECPEPVAEPHFLIEMSEHAQLEWDDENDCSKEGRGLSLDLVVSATERRSLIPTGYDFDLPATEEGWTEIVAAMHRWADGRGFNFIEPTTDFVLDPTSPGANAAVHLFRAGRLSCPFPVDAPDHPCVQP